MHFSWKFRPWKFNATSDRVQRINDVTTFLHLTANEFSLCRSARATSTSDHASVIPTDDISPFRRIRRLSTSNAIRCVLHVSSPRDSEGTAPRTPPFICERMRTASLREMRSFSNDIVRLVRVSSRSADSHTEHW